MAVVPPSPRKTYLRWSESRTISALPVLRGPERPLSIAETGLGATDRLRSRTDKFTYIVAKLPGAFQTRRPHWQADQAAGSCR